MMTSLIQALLVAAVLAILAFTLWLLRLLAGYPAKLLPNSLLNAREQATIAAAADAFFPPAGPIPVSGSEAGIVAYFDSYVRRYRPAQRWLTRLLFAFTEYSPLLFGRRRRRFSRLSLSQRIAFLDAAFTSRIYFRRVAFISMRALMTMAYLSNRDVATHLNMVRDNDPFGIGDRELESTVESKPAAELNGANEWVAA